MDNNNFDTVKEEQRFYDEQRQAKRNKRKKIAFWIVIITLIVIISVFVLLIISTMFLGFIVNLLNGSDNSSANADGTSSYVTEKTELTENDAQYSVIDSYFRMGVTEYGGDTWMEIFMEIENTGTVDLYLGAANFDIESEDGKLITTRGNATTAPSIIRPGETAIYTVSFTDELLVMGKKYNVVPDVDIYRSRLECIRYEVSDVSFVETSSGAPRFIGRVRNNTKSEDGLAYIYVIMYNENGRCIGVIHEIVSLDPGEQYTFDISDHYSYYDVSAAEVASYEIIAVPHQFQFN